MHLMAERDRKYWFPAKRYGCGWGLPVTWQGWFVTIAWSLAVLALCYVTMFVRPRPWLFFPGMAVLVGVLILICRAKGEPPRWRWGDD